MMKATQLKESSDKEQLLKAQNVARVPQLRLDLLLAEVTQQVHEAASRMHWKKMPSMSTSGPTGQVRFTRRASITKNLCTVASIFSLVSFFSFREMPFTMLMNWLMI